MTEQLSPWLAKLSPESRELVRRYVAQAPPLTDRQRERLRLLFRSTTSESAGVA
jgi:DNA-binding CsgD family transcriptional regulator